MKKRQMPSKNDSYQTLENRLISAFGSIFFSLPVCGLYWILSRGLIPISLSLSIIGILALIGFISPRLIPDLFAWALTFILWLLTVVYDFVRFWM
jgi:hypothetical protein